MTARLLCLILLVTGCAQTPPAKPTLNAELIHRQTLARDQAKPMRDTLNASLRMQQVVKATNTLQRQQEWEAQVFIASPNVTAKVTTMINPMNTKGQIMEQQILTYYDNGTMRYATNFFDLSK